MCIAETSTIPSLTPLFLTAASIWGVMWMYSRCFFVLKVRYSVWTLIPLEIAVGGTQSQQDGSQCPRPAWKPEGALANACPKLGPKLGAGIVVACGTED